MSDRNPLACFDLGFLLRMLGAAIVFVLLSVLIRWLDLERGSALRIAIAGLQVIVLGYIIGLTIFSLRRLDELQYRIQLEAVAFAFAASGIVMTGWGVLSKAGLPPVQWGPDTWLLMVLCWALGLWLVRRRYR